MWLIHQLRVPLKRIIECANVLNELNLFNCLEINKI